MSGSLLPDTHRFEEKAIREYPYAIFGPIRPQDLGFGVLHPDPAALPRNRSRDGAFYFALLRNAIVSVTGAAGDVITIQMTVFALVLVEFVMFPIRTGRRSANQRMKFL
jgi:hypothetical protein